jgi:hypothetical protein
MIYNLFLNSTTDNPLTNYFSTVTAANRGQRIYNVNWQFLPPDKKFQVTFRFVSKAAALTSDNVVYLTADFIGLRSVSFSGSNTNDIKGNNILGMLKVRQSSTNLNDTQLSALVSDNEPVIIPRPTNPFIEIKIMDITGAQLNLTTDYILILSFMEL